MHKAKKLPYKTCMLTVPDTHMNTVLTSRERERERESMCVFMHVMITLHGQGQQYPITVDYT